MGSNISGSSISASAENEDADCLLKDKVNTKLNEALKNAEESKTIQSKNGNKVIEIEKGDQDVSDRVQYLIAHHHTYNNIDEIDYQILVEADFLVNIMEDGLSKEAALKAYESIFKTTCGKMICREMFDFCS